MESGKQETWLALRAQAGDREAFDRINRGGDGRGRRHGQIAARLRARPDAQTVDAQSITEDVRQTEA